MLGDMDSNHGEIIRERSWPLKGINPLLQPLEWIGGATIRSHEFLELLEVEQRPIRLECLVNAV